MSGIGDVALPVLPGDTAGVPSSAPLLVTPSAGAPRPAAAVGAGDDAVAGIAGIRVTGIAGAAWSPEPEPAATVPEPILVGAWGTAGTSATEGAVAGAVP